MKISLNKHKNRWEASEETVSDHHDRSIIIQSEIQKSKNIEKIREILHIFFFFYLNVYSFLRKRLQAGEGQRERGTEDLK